MTPKEKANELTNKFAIYLRANLMYDEDAEEDAKQCALITVDEILNEYKSYNKSAIIYDDALNYWQEVKKEIEKL